jgi:hypothetical protein
MISVTYNVMFEKVDKAENLFCLNLSKKKLMLLTYNRHVCKLHESIIARCYRHLAQIGSRVLNLIKLGKVFDENFSKNLVYFVPENVQNRKRS